MRKVLKRLKNVLHQKNIYRKVFVDTPATKYEVYHFVWFNTINIVVQLYENENHFIQGSFDVLRC